MPFTKAISEASAELRQVVWPAPEKVVNNSIVVLGTIAVLIILLTVLDFAFGSFIIQILRS